MKQRLTIDMPYRFWKTQNYAMFAQIWTAQEVDIFLHGIHESVYHTLPVSCLVMIYRYEEIANHRLCYLIGIAIPEHSESAFHHTHETSWPRALRPGSRFYTFSYHSSYPNTKWHFGNYMSWRPNLRNITLCISMFKEYHASSYGDNTLLVAV